MRDDEYTPAERELFERLPRQSELSTFEDERLVNRLRAEGFFKPRAASRSMRRAFAIAAALIVGVLIGWQLAGARTLESQLRRDNLTAVEATALFERARSAYAKARDRYVSATGSEPRTDEPPSAERPGPGPVRTAGVLWF
jgi:2-keto-3-deoxy-galactonokinase